MLPKEEVEQWRIDIVNGDVSNEKYEFMILRLTDTIIQLEEENRKLKADLSYEEYLYQEEKEWSFELIDLLEKCLPFLRHKAPEDLINDIEVRIRASSV